MRRIFYDYLLPCACCVLLLTACGASDEQDEKKAGQAPVRELSIQDVVLAKTGTLADALPFTGTLTAPDSAQISAQVEGTAKQVLVREGERVTAGQVLAVLDNESLRQSLLEQQAQLRNQQSRLELARIKLERQRELLKQGFISQLAFDEAVSDFAVNKGQVDAQAAQLARAKKSLNDTVVRAPISGVIYQRQVNPGEQVPANKMLFAVADVAQLEIAASLPSRHVPQVQVGQQAFFRVEGLNERFVARITRINPVADNSTRTFLVYLGVENPGVLKAGQFASGGIVLREINGNVVLPLAAVNNPETSPWVMVVRQGKLVRQPVKVLMAALNERKVAVSGVTPGSVVLAASLLGVKPGDTVTVPASLPR